MTQRIFDVENEKDMADLWDILPDSILKIEKDITDEDNPYNRYYAKDYCYGGFSFININWHDKTEITRPIQEATEQDIGKICYFWEGKDSAVGILKGIGDDSTPDIYCMEDGKSGIWFIHCRRLTKQEIEELC